jgi:hypothetical protein
MFRVSEVDADAVAVAGVELEDVDPLPLVQDSPDDAQVAEVFACAGR